MRLDQTRIAIRERSYLEILDLALHVIRTRAGGLLLALLAGGVPLAFFNHWLLAGYLDDFFEFDVPFRYLLLMLLLVFWEIPIATAPLTLYLGHVLFAERPVPRRIALEWLQSLPQLFLFQVLLRPLSALFRPFLNEVILLERNPLRAKDASGRSTRQRSRTLHRGDLDPLGRGLGALCLGTLLFGSFFGSLGLLQSLLLGQWEWELSAYTLLFPLALWLVVGYFAVARFLCYLDVRIRREGWEVELSMRAEAARLKRAWP